MLPSVVFPVVQLRALVRFNWGMYNRVFLSSQPTICVHVYMCRSCPVLSMRESASHCEHLIHAHRAHRSVCQQPTSTPPKATDIVDTVIPHSGYNYGSPDARIAAVRSSCNIICKQKSDRNKDNDDAKRKETNALDDAVVVDRIVDGNVLSARWCVVCGGVQ